MVAAAGAVRRSLTRRKPSTMRLENDIDTVKTDIKGSTIESDEPVCLCCCKEISNEKAVARPLVGECIAAGEGSMARARHSRGPL